MRNVLSYLPLVLLLGLNYWISWSNAVSVGRYWSESKEIGGSMRRYVICGYVMAITGFTMVYGYILLLIAPYVLRAMNYSEYIALRVQSLGFDMIYLLVGASAILSGFRIWMLSLRRAWQERTFNYIATAGWNTYAELHNTISYVRNAPSAFGRVFKALFGGKKSRDKKGNALVASLAIIVVILALLGGYFTADAIVKRADAEYDALDEARLAKEI